MSRECDGQYDIYDETNFRARKDHKCDACDETIRPGDVYTRVFMLYDGEKSHVKRCARCQKIHLHLRGLGDSGEQLWPDEELDCGEEYTRHWGVAPPDDIAALAFALPGETKL
jgi:hypothetical protein